MSRARPWESPPACGLAVVSALLMLVPTPAVAAGLVAAPPAALEPADPDAVDEQPPLEARDPEYLVQVRTLIAEGEVMFTEQDYVGAIEPWQQAYDMLTLCERGQLFVPLAIAHWRAYQVDQDEEHLLQAKAMFDRGLESVGNTDERTRRDAMAQLAEVEAELERREAERAQQQRQRAAREAIEQDQRRRKQAEQEALLDRSRRRFGLAMGVGGTAATLGLISLAVMTSQLVNGIRLEQSGEDSKANPESTPMARQEIRRQGEQANGAAQVTGTIGVTLVLVGATAFIVGVLQRQRSQRRLKARLRPGLNGVEVRF